jgi:tetratricopeptide (TPR) repeat protein
MPWLIGHDELTMNISTGFQSRFQTIHDESLARFLETTPDYEDIRREKRVIHDCFDTPPENEVLGLIQDILLSMLDCGEDMQTVCNEPRLVLLEITPDLIGEEAARRRQEEECGNVCKFCCEFVLPDDICRFCKSNGVDPPSPPAITQSFVKPPDLALLSAVILWESAKRQRESISQIAPEILDRCLITTESVTAEANRQIQNPDAFPMTRWRTRMRELKICTLGSFWTDHMEDLLALGMACDWAGKYAEAEIVYHHALSLVSDCEPLKSYKQRIFEGLGQHYLFLKDMDNHEKYQGMATALMNSILAGSQRTGHDDIQSNALKEIIAGAKSYVNQISAKATEIAQINSEAIGAKNSGHFQKAEELILLAISRLGNNGIDVEMHSSLLCDLAEVQKLGGKFAESEESYLKAIDVADELSALRDGREFSLKCVAYFGYAKFQIDMQRREEAKETLLLALDMEEKARLNIDCEANPQAPIVSKRESQIRELLGLLMRETGSGADAEAEAD